MGYWDNRCEIDVLIGKTMESVSNTGDEIIFKDVDGNGWKLFHEQDCCESVYVEDVIGELSDLVGSPILMAEEVEDSGHPLPPAGDYPPDSETWTFYKFATIKGYVTIRFYGSSNGYYSESVNFVKLN